MKKRNVVLAIIGMMAALASPAAQADLYLDASGFMGYTKSTDQDGADSPTLLQPGGGATLGWRFASLLILGVSSDYRAINHMSDVTPQVGNRRGTRFNIVSPTLGIQAGKFLLKGDYQFLGNYKLGNQTVEGADMTFKSPSGFRASLAYALADHVYTGLYYETINFGKQEVSTGTEIELSKKLNVWQIGAVLTFSLTSPGRTY